MISITELLNKRPLVGNYFDPDAYVQGDLEFGLIENRQGARLLALPEILLQAIYAALEQETGQASGLILFNCGRWWGKSFYRRFREEVSNYYGQPLAQMEMIELLQCLKQCWKTHGWGTMDLDLTYYQQGFLVIKSWNSAFAEVAVTQEDQNQPVCFVEAGIISAFFSQLTGQDLHCVQTSCESMGKDCNHFILGLAERLESVEAWLNEGQDHAIIMDKLCSNLNSQV